MFSNTCCMGAVILMIAYLAEITQDGLDWAWTPRAAPTRLARPFVCLMVLFFAAELLLITLRLMAETDRTVCGRDGKKCGIFLVQMGLEMTVMMMCSAAATYYSHHIMRFCSATWGVERSSLEDGGSSKVNPAARRLVSIAQYLRVSVVRSLSLAFSLSLFACLNEHFLSVDDRITVILRRYFAGSTSAASWCTWRSCRCTSRGPGCGSAR